MLSSHPATHAIIPGWRCAIRLPRALDPVEIRVLGCLLEKQQTTPEYYPLTLNALVGACNQKSNREPVVELAAAEVGAALERLRADVLVWAVEGARVARWEHNLDRRLGLDAGAKALITVLLLRGPQTPGELRARTERLHAFASLAEVEAALGRLAADAEPLVVELGREPGRKESRWAHLAGGEIAAPGAHSAAPGTAAPPPHDALAERVARLESRVAELTSLLDRLRASLGER